MGFFSKISESIKNMDPDVKKHLASEFINVLSQSSLKAGDVKIGAVVLPIPPESFKISVDSLHSTINIQNAGNIALMGLSGLKTITIESFIPASDNTYTKGVNAYSYIEELEEIRTSNKPTHILIAGTNVDMDAIITNFSYGEQDCTGDIYFSISLTEYKELEESPEDAVNSQNGLKKRKSFLEKAALNIHYKSGDHVGDVIGRAFIKASDNTENTNKYNQIVKSALKNKSLSIGDIVQAEATDIINKGANILNETTNKNTSQ